MDSKFSHNNISDLNDRKIFFDANVLIYIFWPSGSQAWEKKYSSLFRKLLHQKNELLADFIVISEFVNRAHRIEHIKFLTKNNLTTRNFTYKQYRENKDGKETLSDIYSIVKLNILSHFKIVGKSFNQGEIEAFLVVDSFDFNDKGILSICEEGNFVLLTNDSDFKMAKVDLLSSNPQILNQN